MCVVHVPASGLVGDSTFMTGGLRRRQFVCQPPAWLKVTACQPSTTDRLCSGRWLEIECGGSDLVSIGSFSG